MTDRSDLSESLESASLSSSQVHEQRIFCVHPDQVASRAITQPLSKQDQEPSPPPPGTYTALKSTRLDPPSHQVSKQSSIINHHPSTTQPPVEIPPATEVCPLESLERKNGTGDTRHKGQVTANPNSHGSIHPGWKQCPHASCLTGCPLLPSFRPTSSRSVQIGQTWSLSSCPLASL